MDLKATAAAALSELEADLSLCAGPDPDVIDLRCELVRRIDDCQPLIDVLRELGDEESQTLVRGFDGLSEQIGHCDPVRPVIAELNPLCEAQGIELPPVRRPARSISNDVCWSFFYTVCFSLVFAAIWTQYSKTH
jgi:hypothetical protein